MCGQVRVELLHHLILILLQTCFHYGSHRWNHIYGSFWWFVIRYRNPFKGVFGTLTRLMHRHIDYSMNFQRMHVVFPSTDKFILALDKLNLGVRALLIIIKNFSHDRFLVIRGSPNLKSAVARRVDYRSCLTEHLVFITVTFVSYLRSIGPCGCGRDMKWLKRRDLRRCSFVHDYFI